MTNSTDKIKRIQTLQPLVKNGAIKFNKAHRRLLDECLYFPRGQHDDGLDALEMAVRTAEKKVGRVRAYIIGKDDPNWYYDYQKNLGWPSMF